MSEIEVRITRAITPEWVGIKRGERLIVTQVAPTDRGLFLRLSDEETQPAAEPTEPDDLPF